MCPRWARLSRYLRRARLPVVPSQRVPAIAQLNFSAVQLCHKYQTITIRTTIIDPAMKNCGDKSVAAANTFGISITIPASAIIMAARRARFLSRSSPKPTTEPIPAVRRNIQGPANCRPCSSGAPRDSETASGFTNLTKPRMKR